MPSLSLGRRDTTVNRLRKSCGNCRSSVMCKSRGKCEGCKKICDRFEIVMEAVDEMQMDGTSDENSDETEILGIENRISDTVQEQKGLSYGENPSYTVGSFPPGPVHSLLAKLSNIKDAEPIEQLLVLAKTKLTRPIKSVRPVVIDTAHIFTLNQGGPSKLDVEVHEVKGNGDNINPIASELDREIEKAMEEKRKISGGAASH